MNRLPSIFLILVIAPLAILFGLWTIFSIPAPAYAATHTVNNTNNSGAGSLRQAVLDAQAGDVIEFAANLNGQTISLASQIVLSKSLTIRTTFPIIISGNNATRIFSVVNAEITLEGLILEKGAVQTEDCGDVTDLCGGAIIIQSSGGVLTVKNSTLRQNTANYGGAIFNKEGVLVVVDTTIEDNVTQVAGAGIYQAGGSLTMFDSVVAENSAELYGAGVYGTGATVVISQTQLLSNTLSHTTNSLGGGMVSLSGNLTLHKTTFTGNRAYRGAGLYLKESLVDMTHSTFRHNQFQTAMYGAGLYNDSGLVTIAQTSFISNGVQVVNSRGGAIFNSGQGYISMTHSTIVDNRSYTGGGVYNYAGTLYMQDVLVQGNQAMSAGGIFSIGYMELSYSQILSNTAQSIGGGIKTGRDTVTDSTIIHHTTIAYNRVEGDGGGLSHDNDTVYSCQSLPDIEIHNSTFSHNYAGGMGGGLSVSRGGPKLSHLTITQNEAQSGGSGLYSSNGQNICTRVTHSLIAGNVQDDVRAGNSQQRFVSLGYNIIGVVTGQVELTQEFNAVGDQTAVSNPGLLPLANNGGPTLTHALTADSPALDTGGAICLATDQRGVARPQGSACDIGAVEKQQTFYIYLPLIGR